MEEQEKQTEYMRGVPPHDETAEQAVLCSMFLDREAASVALEVLRGEDFYRPDHRMVFEAAEELYRSGSPIDVITVKNKLEEKGQFEQIGGLPFLANLSSAVGSSVNVRHYAAIVEEKSVLRRLIRTAGDISQLSYEGKEDVNAIMDTAEKSIFDIMQKRHSEQFHHIRDIAVSSIEKIEDIYRSKGKLTGVPTGFLDFDAKTAGLQKSDLILLAARPSMGKTAFVLNISQYMAFRSGETVAIFSLEMSKEQLVNRLLSMESGVDAQKLRNGNLSDTDWERLVEGAEGVARSNLIIDDTPGITLAELRSKCRKYKLENKLGIIMIDYLQLMSGGGRSSDSRQQEISDISRGLKSLARELNVPVVALSQLSRAVEQRPDHRPMLSDLRESGAIEQDADMVMFLYRDSYYNKDTEMKNLAEVIVAKQRNGPIGTINLLWMPEYTTFKNFKPGPPM